MLLISVYKFCFDKEINVPLYFQPPITTKSSRSKTKPTKDPIDKSKTGLGLGLFIGKTLLEKNFASIDCRNSKTRSGAEVIIKWSNKDLFNI